MSWVAEKKAMAKAAVAVNHGVCTGSLHAKANVETSTPTWASSIQLRRRPSRLSSPGRGS